jgi:hypothetical protein
MQAVRAGYTRELPVGGYGTLGTYRRIAESSQGAGTHKYDIPIVDVVWLPRFSQSQPHDEQSVGKTFGPQHSRPQGLNTADCLSE